MIGFATRATSTILFQISESLAKRKDVTNEVARIVFANEGKKSNLAPR